MRVTGTLYVTDHRARIRLRKGTIVVEQRSSWQRVPIESLDGVVLTGRAEITNDAIGELVGRGVRIAALSKSGKLRFSIGGPVSGNVHLRIAQLTQAHDPRSVARVARWIVAGKLQNCRRSMQRWLWDARGTSRWVIEREVAAVADRINGLGDTVDGDRIRGMEGDGSRRYFKCLGLHLADGEVQVTFERRSRRPPRDPVNALLGFTYGLVLAELVGALDAVGLDPQIGFLHRPRSGRPSVRPRPLGGAQAFSCRPLLGRSADAPTDPVGALSGRRRRLLPERQGPCCGDRVVREPPQRGRIPRRPAKADRSVGPSHRAGDADGAFYSGRPARLSAIRR